MAFLGVKLWVRNSCYQCKGLLCCLCRIQTKLMKKPWHRSSEFPNHRRVVELISHVPLHSFHCSWEWTDSNGTLMIALCPFSGQKLLSSVLQLQWWLMNWSCKPLSHPFIQDLFQTVGDTDLLWIWRIQGGIYQPSDTYTSTWVV